MAEFVFQCGCGYHGEVANYIDAAAHYVLCANTRWWSVTCEVCKDEKKIDDLKLQTADPITQRQMGKDVMEWCVRHLVKCFHKTPEDLFDNLRGSIERHQMFLKKNAGCL